MDQEELRQLIGDIEALASNILAYTNIGTRIPLMGAVKDLKIGQAALNDIYCEMFREVEEGADVS